MDIALIVAIVTNVLFVVGILFGFFWGLGRGVKRTSIRLLIFCVSSALAMLISPSISGLLINLKFDLNGATITLGEYLTDMITSSNADLAVMVEGSVAVQEFINKIPVVLVNLATFVLMLYSLKYLGLIVYWIIAGFIRRKEKRRQTVVAPPPTPDTERPVLAPKPKIKKYRWLGGLVGAINGLLLVLLTFLPITGLVSTYNDLLTQGLSASGEEAQPLSPTAQLIKDYIPIEVSQAIEAYNNSALMKVGGALNIQQPFFDAISTVNVGGENVSLRNEIMTVASLYNNVDYFMNLYADFTSFETYDFSQVDFAKLRGIVNTVFDSGTVRAIIPDVVVFALKDVCDSSEGKLSFSTELKAEVKTVLQSLLEMLNGTTNNNAQIAHTFKNDLINAIDLAEIVVTSGLIDVFQTSPISVPDILTILKGEIQPDNSYTYFTMENIINKLFDGQTLRATLAGALNVGLDYLEDTLQPMVTTLDYVVDLGDVSVNNIQWTNVKREINQLAKVIISLMEALDDETIARIQVDPTIILTDEDIDGANLLKDICVTLDIVQNSSLFYQTGTTTLYGKLCDVMNNTIYNEYVDFSKLASQTLWQSNSELLVNLYDCAKIAYNTDFTTVNNYKNFAKTLYEGSRTTSPDDDVSYAQLLISVVNNLLNSDFAKAIKSSAIDLLKQSVFEGETCTLFEGDQEPINGIVDKVFAALIGDGTSGISIIKNDVINLVEIGVDVVESGIIDELLASSINLQGIVALLKAGDYSLITDTISKLCDATAVRTALPDAITYGLGILEPKINSALNLTGSYALDFGDIDTENIIWADIENEFINLLTNATDILDQLDPVVLADIRAGRYLNLLDDQQGIDYDLVCLIIGEMLDILQNSTLFSIDTGGLGQESIYTRLVDAMTNSEYNEFVDFAQLKNNSTFWSDNAEVLAETLSVMGLILNQDFSVESDFQAFAVQSKSNTQTNAEYIEQTLNNFFNSAVTNLFKPEVINEIKSQFLGDTITLFSGDMSELNTLITNAITILDTESRKPNGSVAKVLQNEIMPIFKVLREAVEKGFVNEILKSKIDLCSLMSTLKADSTYQDGLGESQTVAEGIVDQIFTTVVLKNALADALNFGISYFEVALAELNSKPSVNLGRIDTSEIDNLEVSLKTFVEEIVKITFYSTPETYYFNNTKINNPMDIVSFTEHIGIALDALIESSIWNYVDGLADKNIIDNILDEMSVSTLNDYVNFIALKTENVFTSEFQKLNKVVVAVIESGLLTQFANDIPFNTTRIDGIIDCLAESVIIGEDENEAVYHIVSNLLNCVSLNQLLKYGISQSQTFVNSLGTVIDGETELGNINIDAIDIEGERTNIVAFFTNAVMFLKDIDIDIADSTEDLLGDAVSVILSEECSFANLGHLLNSIKVSILFKDELVPVETGIYVNLITALSNITLMQDYVNFTIATEHDFDWNVELSTIENSVKSLLMKDIVINEGLANEETVSLLDALRGGTSLSSTITQFTYSGENNDIDILVLPLLRSELLSNMSKMLVAKVEDTIEEMTGTTISNDLSDTDMTLQANDFASILKAAMPLIINVPSFANFASLDAAMIDSLLLSLEINASQVYDTQIGAFKPSYSQLLQYIISQIDVQVKSLTGGTYTNSFNFVVNDIVDQSADIRDILRKAIAVIKIENITTKIDSFETMAEEERTLIVNLLNALQVNAETNYGTVASPVYGALASAYNDLKDYLATQFTPLSVLFDKYETANVPINWTNLMDLALAIDGTDIQLANIIPQFKTIVEDINPSATESVIEQYNDSIDIWFNLFDALSATGADAAEVLSGSNGFSAFVTKAISKANSDYVLNLLNEIYTTTILTDFIASLNGEVTPQDDYLYTTEDYVNLLNYFIGIKDYDFQDTDNIGTVFDHLATQEITATNNTLRFIHSATGLNFDFLMMEASTDYTTAKNALDSILAKKTDLETAIQNNSGIEAALDDLLAEMIDPDAAKLLDILVYKDFTLSLDSSLISMETEIDGLSTDEATKNKLKSIFSIT